MDGVVTKSTGSWLTVETGDGNIFNCKLKGTFRTKGIKTTNPIAVGDNVRFIILQDNNTGLINEILPRNNYIIRKATKLSKVSHIIAANIDQALLIATLAQPRTSTGFIDRFLVTTEAYHIPAGIIFNKIDLYDNKLKNQMEELIDIYSKAGYSCFAVSALKGDNLDVLKEELKSKKTLFSGHSGVGKSALINALEPSLTLKTKELSGYHGVGMHTTTFAEMIRLSYGGYIIDTPGIKEFGLTDFNRKEIAERFPEMRRYMDGCRFSNCTHVHEPGCAIQKAIAEGKVSKSRYNNYLGILTDDYWKSIENDYRTR
jgi:ribosome biogenesis GTPase / thiamine phosphate phosphatase